MVAPRKPTVQLYLTGSGEQVVGWLQNAGTCLNQQLPE